MKEIKAFIRREKAQYVLESLEKMGINGYTLSDVMGHGQLADPTQSQYSIEYVERFSKISKLELVCRDDQEDAIVDCIRRCAYTGLPGDGIIYVTRIERAIKIRNGAENEAAI